MSERVNLGRLAGVVTGASRGIGDAIARKLVMHDARVISIARHERPEKADSHVPIAQLLADVRDYASISQAMTHARVSLGPLDFLVANAGVGEQSSVLDGDPERWKEVIDVNLLGLAYTIRAALPHLAENGGGHVVIVASVAGRETYVGEPAYVASKWGAVGLGRALRQEGRRYGVRCTLVEPGIVDTGIMHANATAEQWLEGVEPLCPEDIAEVVLFALSQPDRISVNEIVLRPSLQEI
ncbi:MAG: SDR family oxidoreductase [Acidimicrobiales bacterium]